MSVLMQSPNATFVFSKIDGGALSQGGEAFLQTNQGSPGGTQIQSQKFNAGSKSFSFSQNLNTLSGQWPQKFYVRINQTASTGQKLDTWVGPITIERLN